MALKLMAEVGLDGAGFEAGMKRMESTAHHAIEGLKGFVVGSVGIFTVEQALAKTVETAKELVETSERLSIAPEQLQVLRQAAKQSGIELEKLASVFEKIDIARAKALDPMDADHVSKLRSFAAAGVSRSALQTQTAAQLFMGPLHQTAMSNNAENLAPVFREILGKGFGEVLPTLKTNFEELEGKMKSVGAIMDTETAVKLKFLGNELSIISQIIASQLGPTLIGLVELLYAGILKLSKAFMGGTAFWGAFTAKMSPRELASFAIANLTGDTKTLAAFAKEGKFDPKAGFAAMDEAQKPWNDKLTAFAKKLEQLQEEAKQLNNPTAPNFINPLLPEKISKKAFETPSDSLTRVGNFLGGMGIASQIEARKISLLEQIAKNTTPTIRNSGVKGAFDFNNMEPQFPLV